MERMQNGGRRNEKQIVIDYINGGAFFFHTEKHKTTQRICGGFEDFTVVGKKLIIF